MVGKHQPESHTSAMLVGLDLHLAGPSQMQSGMLLPEQHGSGHKRQRSSNDDDDPSGEPQQCKHIIRMCITWHLPKAQHPNAGLLLNADSPHPNGERKVKGPYFEFAKKKWETEDTFR